MPSLASFFVHTDAHPRVSNTDELMIVHRNQIVPAATLYIGAHQAARFDLRTAADREAVEVASPTPHVLPAGGKMKIELTDPLLAVSKITPITGQIYVWIGSMGEFDTYLKQYNVPSI
jgi:hypothetical protein